MRYLDRGGLSSLPSKAYIAALNLNYDSELSDPLPNFKVGDVILTGPWNPERWAYLPSYVRIEVHPDSSYEVKRLDRITYLLKQAGLPLAYRTKPPVPPVMPKKGPTPSYDAKLAKYQSYLDIMDTLSKPLRIELGQSPIPYELVTDPNRAVEIVRPLFKQLYALDYETVGNIIEGIALANDKMSWYLHGPATKVPIIRDLLVHQPGIAHSAIYEYKITAINSMGTLLPTEMAMLHDTRVMNWLLTNKPGTNRLKPLVGEYFPDREALTFLDIAPDGDISKVSPELQARYSAAGDARNTYDLFIKLRESLNRENLWNVYDDIERPLIPVLAEMEMQEIPLDPEVTLELLVHYAKESSKLLSVLRMMGFKDEVKPEAIANWFYKELGIPVLKKTPSGERGSIDAKTLQLLSPDYQEIQVYLAYQDATNLITKFLSRALYGNNGNPITSLKFSLRQTSTRTGRLSSAALVDQLDRKQEGFNTQQFPREIRKIIVPPKGQVIWASDYSQQEPRATAIASQDPTMLAEYAKAKADIYLALAAGIDPTRAKEMRQQLKVYFLAAVYGDFNPYRDQIFSNYPQLVRWRQAVIEEARRTGEARSLFGRRRLVPEVNYKDPQLRAQGEREAVNGVIQMTGADIMKMAMPRVQKLLRSLGHSMWLSIHDELVGAWPMELEEEYGARIDEIMIDIPGIPLATERAHSFKNWYEAKA